MIWKIKVKVKDVEVEAEIPLKEREFISLGEKSTGTSTLEIIKNVIDYAKKASEEIESGTPTKINLELPVEKLNS
jgi:hypothetical protein